MQVKSGMENEFALAWKSLSDEIREKHQSYGASIFRAAKGVHIIVAHWPSRKVWESFWVTKEMTLENLPRVRSCLAKPTQPAILHHIYSSGMNMPGLPASEEVSNFNFFEKTEIIVESDDSTPEEE